jgi:phospholipase C
MFDFRRLGVRVPALLVSPWCDSGVCHAQFDHCSVLKYLCDKWGLPPLGKRTEASSSVGLAIRTTGTPRADTPQFIRVSNQSLIPDHVELEKKSSNNNQRGLHHFADFLHTELDRLETTAVVSAANFARAENRWVSLKNLLGSALIGLGEWLSKDFYRARDLRDERTSHAFTRLSQRADGAVRPRSK